MAIVSSTLNNPTPARTVSVLREGISTQGRETGLLESDRPWPPKTQTVPRWGRRSLRRTGAPGPGPPLPRQAGRLSRARPGPRPHRPPARPSRGRRAADSRLERLSRRVNRLFCLPEVELSGGKCEESHAAKWDSLQVRSPNLQRLGTKGDHLLCPVVTPGHPRL